VGRDPREGGDVRRDRGARVDVAVVDVHVARLEFDSDGGGWEWLSRWERTRARAIQIPERRAEFLASRRMLRELLADRLHRALEGVVIQEGATEKPRLAGGEIEFSCAHRDRWCAVAIAEGCPVGVDLEPIRPLHGLEAVVAHFFPPDAQADFMSAAPNERPAVFFRWWTRLEATAKASGCGLAGAAASMPETPLRSCDAVDGVALAVAAGTNRPLVVDWHLDPLCRRRAS
jgi:4'-phosphopantetheinyl transferase